MWGVEIGDDVIIYRFFIEFFLTFLTSSTYLYILQLGIHVYMLCIIVYIYIVSQRIIMIIMESFNFMMNSYFFFISVLFESDFEVFGISGRHDMKEMEQDGFARRRTEPDDDGGREKEEEEETLFHRTALTYQNLVFVYTH